MNKLTKFLEIHIYEIVITLALLLSVTLFTAILIKSDDLLLNKLNFIMLGTMFLTFFSSIAFGSIYFISCKGGLKSLEYDGSILPKAFILSGATFIVLDIVFGLYNDRNNIAEAIYLITIGSFILYWICFAITLNVKCKKRGV